MGIPEDLDNLDHSIQKLQVEWEKFFCGVERKPPEQLIRQVETLIRKYAYGEMRNNTERFRYQSLTSRYNTFNELWNKRMKAREEGRQPGLHGTKHVPAAESLGLPPTLESVSAAPRREIRFSRQEADPRSVRDLFELFVAARRASGESASVKMESFTKLIQQQTSRILSEKGARAVDFRVESRNGKVTLKAKPVT
ncbi:MAG: hypothetical protein JXO72_00795 [Vicinamibacteria bacterium]|nr:hypothetical protein [Vicinamibacteria bacterium]